MTILPKSLLECCERRNARAEHSGYCEVTNPGRAMRLTQVVSRFRMLAALMKSACSLLRQSSPDRPAGEWPPRGTRTTRLSGKV